MEEAMITNQAKWHKTCRLRYNKMLERAQKEGHESPERHGASRCSRLQSSSMSTEVSCFFCGQAAGNDGLHEVTTFQVDQSVRECAELTGVSILLAKLFAGDMVALEAKYHSKCLLALYHPAEKVHTLK